MGNCLVTKLKAVVNNPDLPVIETMQQFTLDAIAASKNLSMSDAQKAALNHFFYQIGAIDNNGIFAKLELLLLSFMCGTKEGALVDFANNYEIYSTANNTTFSGGGFVSDANNRTIGRYNVSEIDGNYFAFLAGEQVNVIAALMKDTGNGDAIMTFNFKDDMLSIGTSPYTTYSTYISASYSIEDTRRAISVNVRNHSARILLLDGDSISNVNSVTYRQSEEGFAGDMIRLSSQTTNNAPYACAFGSNLTDAEQTTFMNEIKTLMDAFAD